MDRRIEIRAMAIVRRSGGPDEHLVCESVQHHLTVESRVQETLEAVRKGLRNMEMGHGDDYVVATLMIHGRMDMTVLFPTEDVPMAVYLDENADIRSKKIAFKNLGRLVLDVCF